MRFKSVNTKLNIAILGISLVSLVVAFLILFRYENQIRDRNSFK